MELVNSLEKEKSADGALELVWRGSDPVAFSRVISALQAAGIPHHSKSTHDHLVFGLGIPRPRYEVRVLQSDSAMARDLVTPIGETLPFETEKSLQLLQNQSEIPPVAGGGRPIPSPGKWEPRRATVEVCPATIRCLRKFCRIASLRTRLGSASKVRAPVRCACSCVPRKHQPHAKSSA